MGSNTPHPSANQGGDAVAAPDVFAQILNYANRPNPYPLYAELRKTPVARQADGSYVVSTYREIEELLHDPRISSDRRTGAGAQEAGAAAEEAEEVLGGFIATDPPEHDRLRRLAMRQFGPPHTPDRIDAMQPELVEMVTHLIDAFDGKTQVDLVDDFAYPFPVTVICRLLGVPREDEPRFHVWADAIVEAIGARGENAAELRRQSDQAFASTSPGSPTPAATNQATTCCPGWSPTTAPRAGCRARS
jgi:cytochrome P450